MFDKKESLKVKGIAICMLLVHHLFYSQQRITAGGVAFLLLPMEWVIQIATGMRLCVWIFAFISAYGLTKQYAALGDAPTNRQRISFVYKRWLSTMIPYWLIFAIVVVVAGLVYKDPLALYDGSIIKFGLGFLALSDCFGTPMPVAAWWYMCFAQLLILFIPLLVELCRKFGWFALLGAFLLTPYLGSGIVSKFGGSYLNYLFVVILGILCARTNLLERLKGKNTRVIFRLAKGMVLVAVIIALVGINMRYASIDKWRLTKVFMALAAMLVCVFSYVCINGHILGNVLVFLGKHSGNIFLIHAFSYTYWIKLTYWSHNAVLTFLTVLASSLICSIVCQYLLKWIRRLTSHRPIHSTSLSN